MMGVLKKRATYGLCATGLSEHRFPQWVMAPDQEFVPAVKTFDVAEMRGTS